MRYLFYIGCVLLFISCSQETKCNEIEKKIHENNLTRFLFAKERYINAGTLKYRDAFKAYGRPFYIERFLLNEENLNATDRYTLFKAYPEEVINKGNINIYEATWVVDMEHFITVWYEDKYPEALQPIDSLVWNINVEY